MRRGREKDLLDIVQELTIQTSGVRTTLNPY